jgi:hypothetical protein
VLQALRVDITASRGDEVVGHCPAHLARTGKVDRDPSWGLNLDSGLSYCFSCGWRGNLAMLVAEVFGYSSGGRYDLDRAEDFIRDQRSESVEGISARLEEVRDYRIVPTRVSPMSNARLSVFGDPPDKELYDRGLTLDAVRECSVRWDSDRARWILPIRDPDTFSLWGWQEKFGVVVRNRPIGVPKALTLFGIDVWEGDDIVLVESPLDVVRLRSIGVYSAMASFGAHVSDEQMVLLRRAPGRVIVAMDNPAMDSAGRTALRTLVGRANDFGLEMMVFDYGNTGAKDPGEMTAREVLDGMANAVHMLRWRMEAMT